MIIDEPPGEAAARFEVVVEPAREVVRVKPVGELDLASGPVLREQVDELLAVGFAQVIVDLRGLSFIDVTGVRLFLRLADDARRDGWRLSLLPGRERLQRIFRLTHTLDELPFS